MTQTEAATSVRRSVTVSATPERAFEVFTAGIDRWWPRDHHIGDAPLRESVLEPGEGGRWYEKGEDGSECDWGRVLVWEPPHRLVLAWQISADWAYDPELVTEVRVTFTPQDGDRTRVELEHAHLDRFGARAAQMAAVFGSANGWPGMLDAYAATV
ncbi:ATPase [Sphaerisporangium rufum]|uniref:ATPase n=1 Tax=Sphaerisporangium rufum TaxID=1381558 RepID=A0A919R2S2_9ACTN|nr:SRPBCC family protein [Sphaerisporangium rufum]GII78617.1 ATPase [Sphaerisporangium rufum]